MGTSFTFSMVGSDIQSLTQSKRTKLKQKKPNQELQAIEEEELSVQICEDQNHSERDLKLPSINNSPNNSQFE